MNLLPPFPSARSVRLAQAFFLTAMVLMASAGVGSAARAAEPLAVKPAAEPGRSYVVAPGDTLDRIVQKTMGSSPLRIELLREAMVAANPQAIAGVRNPRLKAGAVLQLPDHEALLRATVLPLLAPAEMAALTPNGGEAARKRWVRYP